MGSRPARKALRQRLAQIGSFGPSLPQHERRRTSDENRQEHRAQHDNGPEAGGGGCADRTSAPPPRQASMSPTADREFTGGTGVDATLPAERNG